MIPPLTTMPAASAAAAIPAAIDAAIPGFAALLATAAPVVTRQPAPMSAPTPAPPVAPPMMTPLIMTPLIMAQSIMAPSIMAPMLAVGMAAGRAASAPVAAAVLVTQSAPTAPALPTDPGAPSRVAAIPIGVAPSPSETWQPPMLRVSLAAHRTVAVDVQRLPLPPQSAPPVGVASPPIASAVSAADTQPPGRGKQVSPAEPTRPPQAEAAVSSVVSIQTARPLHLTAEVADLVSPPEPDQDRVILVTDELSAAASEAFPSAPTTADAPRLAPSLSFGDAAVSAPMVSQAAASAMMSMPPASALTRAEPVPALASPQRPDSAAAALRASLPVAAPMLPVTAPTTVVSTGTEPIAAPAAPSMPLAAKYAAVPAIMLTISASVPRASTAAALPNVATMPTPAAIMPLPPSVLAPLATPVVADPDLAGRSIVQATAPAAALSPAMTLVSPQPAASAVPAAINTLPREAGASLRAGNGFAAVRLPRDVDDREAAPGLLAIAEPAPMRTALRTEATVGAASPVIASVEISNVSAVALALDSGRLGAVSIGVEGGASDLKVSLGLSPAAAALVVAEVPRLIADLAAGGVRLQSLDVSGGGVAGGQQQPQSHHAPAGPRTGAAPATMNPVTVRPSTADRYA